jgi:NAD(P)-dependent dehydrogenase (short-subunit alcohol dehydrogenase family)
MSHNNKWTTKDIPNLIGKIAIVTGANSGIGYEAARELAKKDATVIMACRDVQKGQAAAGKIREEYPAAHVPVMQLDLADMSSISQFADTFCASYENLDILINNAGVMALPYQKTADGFEKQFGTNHLGHFALTGQLLGCLKNTADSRVVSVSSTGHMIGGFNFDDLNSEKFYFKWLAYGKSKLANLLFAYELQRRLEGDQNGTISVGVHPGYASTHLQDGTEFQLLNPLFAQSQEMGALPTLYAATAEDVRGGDFIGPDGFMQQHGYPKKLRSSKASYNEQTANMLWEVSEEMTGVTFDFE